LYSPRIPTTRATLSNAIAVSGRLAIDLTSDEKDGDSRLFLRGRRGAGAAKYLFETQVSHRLSSLGVEPFYLYRAQEARRPAGTATIWHR